MSAHPLRGVASIVGVAESDLGDVGADRFSLDLATQAALRALDDAGLRTTDVDGLYSCVGANFMSNLDVGAALGLRPRLTGAANIGGSGFVSNVLHAAAALYAGLAETVLIVYGSTPRADHHRKQGYSGGIELPSYQAPYRPRDPITGYALATARHMHQYGTTREQLAEVAVAARAWALMNPVAFNHSKGPLTVADVLASPMVASPLSLRDCCLVTDGGGAIVMTRTERACDLRRAPIPVLGVGEAHWHRHISQMPDLTVTCATESGARAFAMAGLSPHDVDVLQLYDAFTINPILFLEDLGFCAKGEGGAFVSGGRIAPGGALPVNTNGGGLSYCHPGMYGIFTLIESVRQLRGEAGPRQVAGAKVGIAHGNGGQLSSQVTAVLGTLETL